MSSEPRTVYDPDDGPVPADRRLALCDWLRANGIDPDDVPLHSTISIETTDQQGPGIRHTVYLRNAGGRKYLDEATGDAAQDERIVPLSVPPPTWLSKERIP